jgi:hypothetical protein
VNLSIGLVALAMVWLGMPKQGVSPPFMRNGAVELLYPVVCLTAFVAAAGGILTALPWTFF